MPDFTNLPTPTPELVASVHRDMGKLSAARAAVGMSQADVARVCGVSRGAVNRWEHGTRLPGGLAASALRVLLDGNLR